MIYRSWSLLSSTVVIWGGVATAGLAGIFLFGGKAHCKFLDTKNHGSSVSVGSVMEKFQNYLSREGERLRKQDRAAMGKN
uniref:Uncharacterized protein n=1 Tax=Leersia perrieri TaxID=77586 RepID=A0A0D9WL77_9ORYZ